MKRPRGGLPRIEGLRGHRSAARSEYTDRQIKLSAPEKAKRAKTRRKNREQKIRRANALARMVP